jgi:hypothetical protein
MIAAMRASKHGTVCAYYEQAHTQSKPSKETSKQKTSSVFFGSLEKDRYSIHLLRRCKGLEFFPRSSARMRVAATTGRTALLLLLQTV